MFFIFTIIKCFYIDYVTLNDLILTLICKTLSMFNFFLYFQFYTFLSRVDFTDANLCCYVILRREQTLHFLFLPMDQQEQHDVNKMGKILNL